MRDRNTDGRFCEVKHDKFHKGYRVIYMPNHPHARENGYVYEHILVMETKIGRLLNSTEVVHHIDGNKLNNNPDNLMLFENNIEHLKHHWKSRRHKYQLANGRLVTTDDIVKMTGVPYATVYQRIHRLGWSADETIAGHRIAEEMRKDGREEDVRNIQV